MQFLERNYKYGHPESSKLGAYFSKSISLICFFIMKNIDVVSFADDNTPYMSASNFTNLAENLEDSACLIFTWFANNQIQGNATKCHVLLSTK